MQYLVQVRYIVLKYMLILLDCTSISLHPKRPLSYNIYTPFLSTRFVSAYYKKQKLIHQEVLLDQVQARNSLSGLLFFLIWILAPELSLINFGPVPSVYLSVRKLVAFSTSSICTVKLSTKNAWRKIKQMCSNRLKNRRTNFNQI